MDIYLSGSRSRSTMGLNALERNLLSVDWVEEGFSDEGAARRSCGIKKYGIRYARTRKMEETGIVRLKFALRQGWLPDAGG